MSTDETGLDAAIRAGHDRLTQADGRPAGGHGATGRHTGEHVRKAKVIRRHTGRVNAARESRV